MPNATDTDFDGLSLEALRERQSAKWRVYPEDVLPAWVAEMDVPLAAPIRRALLAAVERGDSGYAHADPRLAQAFAAFARRRWDWPVDAAHVRLVPDVIVDIAEVLRALTGPGDGVVLNTPVYPPFFAVMDEIGRQVVEAPLARGPGGYQLDLEAAERALAAGARAWLLCNPHNPTGLVLRRGELEAVVELAARHGAVVVGDEVHGPLTLPGATHVPLLSLGEEAAARTVALTSASKAWNLPGLKCAVVVTGSAAMQARLQAMPEDLHYRCGLLGLIASTVAFQEGEPWLEALLGHLDRNRRLLTELLDERLPAVGYVPPQASFLAWLDCGALGLGPDPAAALLRSGRVALNSGLDFGRQGAGFARLNIGTSAALLTEAVDRMAKGTKGTKGPPP
ncbi:MAG TPA: aminotransferase class I/II-fold pyridoxal phosphate-dependent enzyme [Actinomycetes bacterium]|nr:aminotransferase class I/II-fold pyridoxal phosphate-dependent enzyme [Actinomycetes bacterium]